MHFFTGSRHAHDRTYRPIKRSTERKVFSVEELKVHRVHCYIRQFMWTVYILAALIFLFGWELSLFRTTMPEGLLYFWGAIGVVLFCIVASPLYHLGWPWGRVLHHVDESGCQYRNWRGAIRRVAWGRVARIAFEGENWDFGPASRYFSNAGMILVADRERVRLDLTNYHSPRRVVELVIGLATKASPALIITSPSDDWSTHIDGFLDNRRLAREFLQNCERHGDSPRELLMHLRKRVLYLTLVPLLAGILSVSMFIFFYETRMDFFRTFVVVVLVTGTIGRCFSKGLVQTLDLILLPSTHFDNRLSGEDNHI